MRPPTPIHQFHMRPKIFPCLAYVFSPVHQLKGHHHQRGGSYDGALRPSLRDSMIRNTTIDRIPNYNDEKFILAIRFTSQHIDRHQDGHAAATQVL
jgi:hypothetical protein